MNRFFANLVLLSSTFMFVTAVGFTLTYEAQGKPSIFSSVKTSQRTIYKDASGMPKYAMGTCKVDADCVPSGCSSEICAKEKNLITSCVVKDDYPSKIFYKCGCVKNLCVWYNRGLLN